MSMRLSSSLLLLASVALPVSAMEFDIRLTAGTAAMLDHIDATSEGSADLADETSGSGSLTGHLFFGDGLLGFMVGAGFKSAVHAGDQEAGGPLIGGQQLDITYTGKAALLEAGLTIKPFNIWRIEVRPQLTVGQGEIEIDVSGDNIEGDSGDYVAFGGVIGNYLRFGWFEIGVDLGYESFTGKSKAEGVDTESEGEGFIAQLGVGVIF